MENGLFVLLQLDSNNNNRGDLVVYVDKIENMRILE